MAAPESFTVDRMKLPRPLLNAKTCAFSAGRGAVTVLPVPYREPGECAVFYPSLC